MAITQSGINSTAGFFGGAVSDFFGSAGAEEQAHGEFAAAVDYANARDIALQNRTISQNSTELQLAQQNRKIFQTIGTENAQLAGANVQGGSAGDLLRSSMQQGALSLAVTKEQGAINANAFSEEAESLQAQENSAVAAGNALLKQSEAGKVGGFMNLLGGVASLGLMLL